MELSRLRCLQNGSITVPPEQTLDIPPKRQYLTKIARRIVPDRAGIVKGLTRLSAVGATAPPLTTPPLAARQGAWQADGEVWEAPETSH